MINNRGELTPREYEQMKHEREMAELHSEHAKELKRMEIEVLKIEAKWASWLRIPIVIITLPVRFLFGVGYIVAVARGKEPSDKFWDYIR